MKPLVLASFFDLKYVQFFNFWYFFFIIATAVSVFVLDGVCAKKGRVYTDRLVMTLVWINFGLHLFKQFFPGYREKWPDGFADSLCPNFCAALILFSPFILHWGRPSWKDYMYYMGVISGIVAILLPSGLMRYDDFPNGITSFDYVLEVVRYYFCHAVIILAGYLMVAHGSHKLEFSRIKYLPFTLLFICILVGAHSIIWGPIFKLKDFPHDWLGEDGVLNNLSIHNQIANQSMIFGPQPSVDGIIRPIAKFFIPYLMVYNYDGKIYFTPILWVEPFFLILIATVGSAMTYPFDKLGVKSSFEAFRQRRRMAKEKAAQ